jgi:hypothetical protein
VPSWKGGWSFPDRVAINSPLAKRAVGNQLRARSTILKVLRKEPKNGEAYFRNRPHPAIL